MAKSQGHATMADVEKGLLIAHERAGSQAADSLAKRGAACHPMPTAVARAIDAADDHIKRWGAFVGQLGARMGNQWPRDSSGKRQAEDPYGRTGRQMTEGRRDRARLEDFQRQESKK